MGFTHGKIPTTKNESSPILELINHPHVWPNIELDQPYETSAEYSEAYLKYDNHVNSPNCKSVRPVSSRINCLTFAGSASSVGSKLCPMIPIPKVLPVGLNGLAIILRFSLRTVGECEINSATHEKCCGFPHICQY